MPVTFQIDTRHGIVLTKATGVVTHADIVGHLRAKEAAAVANCAELFDARDVSLDLSFPELKAIAEEINAASAGMAPRRVAVITNSAYVYGVVRAYAELASGEHLRIFSDVQDSQAWILATAHDLHTRSTEAPSEV